MKEITNFDAKAIELSIELLKCNTAIAGINSAEIAMLREYFNRIDPKIYLTFLEAIEQLTNLTEARNKIYDEIYKNVLKNIG